jgi:hypothetical protein
VQTRILGQIDTAGKPVQTRNRKEQTRKVHKRKDHRGVMASQSPTCFRRADTGGERVERRLCKEKQKQNKIPRKRGSKRTVRKRKYPRRRKRKYGPGFSFSLVSVREEGEKQACGMFSFSGVRTTCTVPKWPLCIGSGTVCLRRGAGAAPTSSGGRQVMSTIVGDFRGRPPPHASTRP